MTNIYAMIQQMAYCEVSKTCVQLLVCSDRGKQRSCNVLWKMDKIDMWIDINHFVIKDLTNTYIQ